MQQQRFYISRNYKSVAGAASKPKTDCERILDTLGFKNLGFRQTTYKSSAVGAMINFFGITKGLLRLPRRSVLCVQYPLSKYYNYIIRIASLKKSNMIVIVHDIKTLMNGKGDVDKELKKFSKASALVVHNDRMSSWLKDRGLKQQMFSNYLFDYLTDQNTPNNAMFPDEGAPFDIVYAGGLGKKRSGFLYAIKNGIVNDYKLVLFGKGFDEDAANSSMLDYRGMFSPNEVVHHLSGSFGLVWSGTSTEECTGSFGNYLRYNNPHKTSLYILGGLPIVIWNKAAMADFIEKEKIGISVSSLNELDEKLRNIKKEDHQQMVANVLRVRDSIVSGGFLRTAMTQALSHVEQ